MEKQLTQTLFEKFKLGDITLSNRIIMAAMTRAKCDKKTGIPTDLHCLYYSQRASAGLIFTESSPIANNAQSFMGNGGIYTSEQVQAWKKVTDAVHAKKGKIFLQIWHAGRQSISAFTGEECIAPSSIRVNGELVGSGTKYEVPREMTKYDIKKVLEQFRQGALNAKAAGFDGLELHGGTGFLIEQFLKESSNQRTDEYGGSIENRARFCLEVMDVLIEVFGAKRVGIKLTPVGRHGDMYDSNPLGLYTYLLKQLDRRGIAFIELLEPGPLDKNFSPEQMEPEKQMPHVCKILRPYFSGAIIINNNQTPESAVKAIESGDADLVSFGKNFISNPDYVERVKNGWEVNGLDFSTLYSPGEKGYTDYAFYKAPKKPSGGLFACFT